MTGSAAVVANDGPDSLSGRLRVVASVVLVVAGLYGLLWAVMGIGMAVCKAVIALFPESWDAIFKVVGGAGMALCAALIVAILFDTKLGRRIVASVQFETSEIPAPVVAAVPVTLTADALRGATRVLAGMGAIQLRDLIPQRYTVFKIGSEIEKVAFTRDGARVMVEGRRLMLSTGDHVINVIVPDVMAAYFGLKAGASYQFVREGDAVRFTPVD